VEIIHGSRNSHEILQGFWRANIHAQPPYLGLMSIGPSDLVLYFRRPARELAPPCGVIGSVKESGAPLLKP